MSTGKSSLNVVDVVTLAGAPRALVYQVPEDLQGRVGVGSLVRIPLLNRSVLGVIVKMGSNQKVPTNKLKKIHESLCEVPLMTPDLLKLASWLQQYYAASSDSVYEAMIPASIRRGMKPKTSKFLKLQKKISQDDLAKLKRRAPKQADLYEYLLKRSSPVPQNKVLEDIGVAPSICKALIEKGLVVEILQREERTAYDDSLSHAETLTTQNHDLTEEQAAACKDIENSLSQNDFKVHLLHGVTGSGKTEVYLQAMTKVLEQGGSVLFLVPEVTLTPQTVGRLRSRLESTGIRTVVWHSQLSEGERFDAWLAMARGEAHVVVGARSAIFAPLPNLRLIIVDEEHETAYKQGETPRYHGRDVAIYRAMLCKAVCVLGSATPSLESLYNVNAKKYQLNRLTSRVDDRELPRIHVVDMKPELLKAKASVTISRVLADKLHDRFEAKEQSILFINRRGYSSKMLCPECGYLASCGHCSVSLTYHRTDNKLRCHVCGHQQKAPQVCPQCSSEKIRWRGFGTQKVEDIVQKILPKARIVRMDADTMSKKNLFREILADFRHGKIDILVGTQMIAKGLDFPNVTLVGLIDADLSLHIQDFRASERTFQLIVQVAGRAGRGDRAGEVVVQSFMPYSAPIQFARRADFDGFLEEELEQRKEFHYPPYRHIIRHIFRGRNLEKVEFYAEKWAQLLEKKMPNSIEIRGPAPAPLEKIKDHYRYHMWIFTNRVSRVLPEILKVREDFTLDKDVTDVFDVDPVDLC